MIKSLLVLLCVIAPCAGAASAQSIPDTLYTVRQELPLPANDSGGRWLPSAMIFTSITACPTHIQLSALGIFDDNGNHTADSAWRLADSAYYLADSIDIDNFSSWTASNQPWKYIDTSGFFKQLEFLLPPHGTLRIPIMIQAITHSGPPGEIVSHIIYPTCYSDSLGKRRVGGGPDSVRCIAMYGGLVCGWQETVPANDSGGRWLPSTVAVKSIASYPIRLMIALAQDSSCKLADTALFMADSIYVTNNTYYHYTSGTPAEYIDSIHGEPTDGFYASLGIMLPAHGMLHIPFLIRANGDTYSYDTAQYVFSVWYQDRNTVWYSDDITVGCPWACSGPFVQYDGEPVDNQSSPMVIGGNGYADIKGKCSNCTFSETTYGKYKLVGEYSDRFTLPDTLFHTYANVNDLLFSGAPKSPIHDTLYASYSNCWGTISTVTPITAYSAYPDGYEIRQIASLTAPFLGSVQKDVAVVTNTSDFPITVRNVKPMYYAMDFQASGPTVIAAHDSGYISVTLSDNDIYLDTLNPERNTVITGTIAPYQQEINFADSSFSIGLTASIDVYSPKYFAAPPKLKRGQHPRGIIFTSSYASTFGDHEFLTDFGNYDSTREYFEMPYYDDSRFSLAVGQYLGPAVTLPGFVDPDTTFFAPGIQVMTTYTGDSYHNYYTKLHFPRQNDDTTTIDVVAVGNNAPAYQGVSTTSASDIAIWPNPASQVVHFKSIPLHAGMIIMDALGRIVKKQSLSETSMVDVSDLPSGLYEFYFPSLGITSGVEIFH